MSDEIIKVLEYLSEKVGRNGDEVHYREHLSNGMTVDRYTREGE